MQQLAAQTFGVTPLRVARPEEAIALGAAAHASQLQAAQTWSLEFFTLMTVAMLYAHLVEEPLVRRVRKLTDRHTSAPRVKVDREA